MQRPKVLLLDESSAGLSPLMVNEVMRSIKQVAEQRRLGVLLVEQNVKQALAVADRVNIMKNGQIVTRNTAAELLGRPSLLDLF